MKVILKKDKKSAKFNVTFKKGIALNYSSELESIQHPTMSNVWLKVKSKDFEVAKNYVIMGDNNFWYSTTGEITKDQLDKEIDLVMRGIEAGDYDHNSKPNELHVFETGWSDTIEI